MPLFGNGKRELFGKSNQSNRNQAKNDLLRDNRRW